MNRMDNYVNLDYKEAPFENQIHFVTFCFGHTWGFFKKTGKMDNSFGFCCKSGKKQTGSHIKSAEHTIGDAAYCIKINVYFCVDFSHRILKKLEV